MTEKINEYYNKIAQTLEEIIPCDWETVYLYAEEKGDIRYTSFYYFTQDTRMHFSGAIPFAYDISFEHFDAQMKALKKIIHDLWLECQKEGQPAWHTLMFDIDKKKHFQVTYAYERNDDVSGWEGEARWAYDKFGKLPTQRVMRRLLAKYLVEQGQPLPDALKDDFN